MSLALSVTPSPSASDRQISDVFARERARLAQFVRRRVGDPADTEDIVQEVFTELVEAWRLPEPIEQVGAWLMRVARNRIVDRFRKHKESPLLPLTEGEDEDIWLDAQLPSEADGPEAAYTRRVGLAALQQAIDDLPPEQREVFLAHEVEGLDFKTMAAHSGVAVNTLLARKRYAVLRLRAQLQSVYDELDF